MNELSNSTKKQIYRLALLSTASAIALVAATGILEKAVAKDDDRPTVWLEGGWHYEALTGKTDPYDPAFFSAATDAGFVSPALSELAAPYSYGAEGKISIQPKNSDWIFSVAARYGRSTADKNSHEEKPAVFQTTKYGVPGTYALDNNFTDTRAKTGETHLIVDFQVGKDVGLGIHSVGISSILNFGVRFAQLRSHSQSTIAARPKVDANMKYFSFLPVSIPYTRFYNRYDAKSSIVRSFAGIGPSISWNASAPMVGDTADGELALDFGAAGALLFGRQKVTGSHQTTVGYYKTRGINNLPPVVHHYSADIDRSRSVIVPNLGGFAGLSYRFTSAKLSVGYRADFFFGAMDGGVDNRKTYNRAFHGPFATISIGLGGYVAGTEKPAGR